MSTTQEPTRAQSAEIAAVRERLKAAAKSTAPVTRRAAQQMSEDLYQWERWTLEGITLPRLPRRIRLGLATPVKQHKKKERDEKIITENVLNPTAHGTKQIEGALSPQILLEWLATDRHTCLHIAKALVQSHQNAEEVISKCMASAVEQIHAGAIRADNAARFHAWLHQVVRFSCYRFVKRQKTEVELTEGALQDRDIAISKRLPSADEQHYSF
jgi:sigma-70-like protein